MRPRIAGSPPDSPPEGVGADNSQLTVAQTEAKVEQQASAEDSQDSVPAQTPPSVPAETSG